MDRLSRRRASRSRTPLRSPLNGVSTEQLFRLRYHIRLSYSKPRQEVLNEDIQSRPSTLPDFHPQRAIRAEGFYGFDEALKQDV